MLTKSTALLFLQSVFAFTNSTCTFQEKGLINEKKLGEWRPFSLNVAYWPYRENEFSLYLYCSTKVKYSLLVQCSIKKQQQQHNEVVS